MNTVSIQIFEPPMCCPTGVCGPSVDPVLTAFNADLEWIKNQGVQIQRYNLSQQPAAFAENEVVRSALQEKGNGCLPLIVADGEIIKSAQYPSREELSRFAGIDGSSCSEQQNTQPNDSGCCSSSGCC